MHCRLPTFLNAWAWGLVSVSGVPHRRHGRSGSWLEEECWSHEAGCRKEGGPSQWDRGCSGRQPGQSQEEQQRVKVVESQVWSLLMAFAESRATYDGQGLAFMPEDSQVRICQQKWVARCNQGLQMLQATHQNCQILCLVLGLQCCCFTLHVVCHNPTNAFWDVFFVGVLWPSAWLCSPLWSSAWSSLAHTFLSRQPHLWDTRGAPDKRPDCSE